MGLFDDFPYSNLHELNLDWLIKTVKNALSKAVLSINGKTGIVELTAEDVGAVPAGEELVQSVNGKTGIVELTAEDVGAVPAGEELVQSVNGKTGIVELTAEDVGAVPAGEELVQSVNGKTGIVELTAEDVGALADTVTTLPNPNAITFTGASVGTYDGSEALTINIPEGGGTGAVTSVNGQTGTVVLDATDVGALADTVTTLPNPNAITFTGASVGTYDGSEALTINIPEGGGTGAVTSVNGQTGTVVLGAEDVGALSSTISTTSIQLNSYNSNIPSGIYMRFFKIGRLVIAMTDIVSFSTALSSSNPYCLLTSAVPEGYRPASGGSNSWAAGLFSNNIAAQSNYGQILVKNTGNIDFSQKEGTLSVGYIPVLCWVTAE